MGILRIARMSDIAVLNLRKASQQLYLCADKVYLLCFN